MKNSLMLFFAMIFCTCLVAQNTLGTRISQIQAKDTASSLPIKDSVLINMQLWLPYIVSFILLALLVFFWMENNKNKKKKEDYKLTKRNLQTILDSRQDEFIKLKKEIEELKKELDFKELDLKYLEDRLQNIENEKIKTAENEIELIPILNEESKPVIIPQPQTPTVTIKYARYADMGDGFSNAGLLDTNNSETIFEIAIINSNTATYKVIDDLDNQKYALSNAQYFLGKTCQYDSFPAGKNNIITESPGVLKLQGAKWLIQSVAKISFN